MVIVPDQKVTAGALNVVVNASRMLLGMAGECVPIGTPTLKSVEIRERRFREKIDSTLETAKSPLYIKEGGCRAVVMTHTHLAVTKSWEV